MHKPSKGNKVKLNKLICFILLFLLSACRDDKEKNADYSGISELISDRNKARQEAAKKNSGSKSTEEKISTGKKESDLKTEEEISPVVLYEEKVDIVGSESRRTLSKGVAYINKKGQIVKIKILTE